MYELDTTDAAWFRSTKSDMSGGNCLEIAYVNDGVAIRDSKNPDGPHLSFTRPEFDAFVGGAKDGEFDPE